MSFAFDFRCIATAMCLSLISLPVLSAEFSPTLDRELSQVNPDEFVSAIVILPSAIDIEVLDQRLHLERASRARRHAEVLAALKSNADATQPRFRAELDAAMKDGSVKGYTCYWIENLVVLSARRSWIESLRSRGDVQAVTENFQAELIQPVYRSGDEGDHHAPDNLVVPSGIYAVGAIQVNEELGITGEGVLIANLDTGVQGTHPALSARWRGNTAPHWQCWLDAVGVGSDVPVDLYGHGTHVMGTMAGREITGEDTTWVGCAPGAEWIASNAIFQSVGPELDNYIIHSFQWFADPDTVNHSLDAVPDVIQNSWGVNYELGYETCFDLWNGFILNCEAAGTVVTFSAGNEAALGLRSPAIYSINETQMFSVGAVNATSYPFTPYILTDFSSQGPTPCEPAVPNNIKPEIVAPGYLVYSASISGGYELMSGTSMAGPHVAGVIALMREACPDCDPQTIKETLINTAIRDGYVTPPATENNLYGNGFIDAMAAVQAVSVFGNVAGLVTDDQNNPLSDVRVREVNSGRDTRTNSYGSYTFPLPQGTYDLDFWKFGYEPQTAYGVHVVTGQTTTLNVTMPTASQGQVSGTVTGCDSNPADGATVELLNTPLPPATTDNLGHYSISCPQGIYDMRASGAGCGQELLSDIVVGEATVQNFILPTDPIYLCSEPDLHGYIACENGDPGGPVFDWIEISPAAGGPGLSTGLAYDDETGILNLPFPFFFYGGEYTTLYVCTNGYFRFLGNYDCTYQNRQLPFGDFGAAILPYWDDLNPGAGGDISYYHHTAQNAFIVEFHEVPHHGNNNLETFQVWFYNEIGNNGDSRLKFQYLDVTQDTSCTVGIQDGIDANVYAFNQFRDIHAQGLADGRVIAYGGNGCVGGPQIAVTPATVGAYLAPHDTLLESIQICNQSDCPLSWNIVFTQLTPPEPPVSDQGGPDNFGYTWVDSNEPEAPLYDWLEIADIGSNTWLTGGDEMVSVDLPWPFPFYGNAFTTVNLSTNGNLQFGSGGSAAPVNGPLPDASAPGNLIAPFWDDLWMQANQSNAYYYADPDNQRFVIQYDGIQHFGPFTPGNYTFQVHLYRNGNIKFLYQSMSGTLNSATIGIQNASGTDGLQVVCNAPYVANSLVVWFTAPILVPDWMSIIGPTHGTLDPAQCWDAVLRFDAGDYPQGQYQGTITVASNDADNDTLLIPVNLYISDLEAPDSLTLHYMRATNQLRFEWKLTGALQYTVLSSPQAEGPFDTVVGTTAEHVLFVPYSATAARMHYVVVAESARSHGLLRSAPVPVRK